MIDIPVFILTEGFSFTGYGHVSRCSALAQAFRSRNLPVTFIVNGDERIKDMLADYPVHLFDWLQDAERLSACLDNAAVIVVDSYLADRTVYERLQGKSTVNIYLDDFNRLDYPDGIVVNGTMGAEQIAYYKRDGLEYLLGGAYVILREAFHQATWEREFSSFIGTVLLTFGGTDPFHMTVQVLDGLVKAYPEWQKLVVLGAAFSDGEAVEKSADAHTRLFYNVNAETMKQLMLSADVALSAAGQTINELAVTGLPSVIFKVAGNQENNIAGWKASGFIDSYIDATQQWTFDEVAESLNRLASLALRRRFSERGTNAVDGKGCDRIVKRAMQAYIEKKLTVARAEEKDLWPLFELANDPQVRRNSFSSRAISKEEHTCWFRNVLSDPDRMLYVFYMNDRLLAQIRLDRDADTAVISISLSAAFRGLGLAPKLLRIALQEYKNQLPDSREVYAYVKEQNKASQQTFVKAGFRLTEKKQETLQYSYTYGKELIY